MADKSGSASTGPFSLVIVKGPDAGKAFDLEASREYIIGRSEECNIRIESDKMVSRKHVLLRGKPGTGNMVLENLSQTNPVQVRGKAVTSTVLKPKDKFQLGETVFVLNAPAGPKAGTSGKPDKKVLLLAGLAVLVLLLLVVMFSGKKDTGEQPLAVNRPDLATTSSAPGKPYVLPGTTGITVSDKDKTLADEHFRQGLFFYDTGNLSKAVDEWERAISLNPEHADARLWFLKAEKELAEKVKGHYQSAMLHYKYMRYKEAADEFKMVVALSRDKNSDQYINALRHLDELRNK